MDGLGRDWGLVRASWCVCFSLCCVCVPLEHDVGHGDRGTPIHPPQAMHQHLPWPTRASNKQGREPSHSGKLKDFPTYIGTAHWTRMAWVGMCILIGNDEYDLMPYS